MREFASSPRFGTVAFLVCYAVLCTQTDAPVEALDDTHQGGMGANEGKTVEMPKPINRTRRGCSVLDFVLGI